MRGFRIAGIAALAALPLLCGCSTNRETDPPRSATEQLLISAAADRAAEKMRLDLGSDRKCFLDTTNFDGLDAKYAAGAIRASLLKNGTRFVSDKKDADTIIEIRAGALSIDRDGTLVGIPALDLGPISTPELALYKSEEQQGVAKFAATAFDAKDGHYLGESRPPLGKSQVSRHVILLVSWTHDDVHNNGKQSEHTQTGFAPEQ